MKDNRTSPFLSDLSEGVRTVSGSMKTSLVSNPSTPAAISYGRFNNFSDSGSQVGTTLPDFASPEKPFTVLEGVPNALGRANPTTGSIGSLDIYGTKIYSDVTLDDGTRFRGIAAQRGFRLPLYRNASGDATEPVFIGKDFTGIWPENSLIDETGITFMLKFLIRQSPNGKALLSVGTGAGAASVAFNIAFDNPGNNIVASHKAAGSDSTVTFNIQNHYDKFLTMFASVRSSGGAPVVQQVALYDTATGGLIYGPSNGSAATGAFLGLTQPRLYVGYGDANGGSNNAFSNSSFLKNVDIAEIATYRGMLNVQQQDVIVRSTLPEVNYKSGFNNRAPRRYQQILDSRTAYPNSTIPERPPENSSAFDDTRTLVFGTGSVGRKEALMFPEMLPASMFSGSFGSTLGAPGDTRKFYRDVHHTDFDKRLVAEGHLGPSTIHQETHLLNLASRNSPVTISQDTDALGGTIAPFHDDNPILDLVSRQAVDEGVYPELDQRLGDHVAIVIDLNPSTETTIGVERDSSGAATGRVTSMAYYNFATSKWETAGKNNDFIVPGAITVATGALSDGLAQRSATIAENTALHLFKSASVGFAGTCGFTIYQNAGADSLGALALRGAPTSNYGFPTANKYEAKDNQLINMGDYIDSPFILERVQFQFGAAIEESGPHSLGYRQDIPDETLPDGEKAKQFPELTFRADKAVPWPTAPGGNPESKSRYLGRGDFINGSDMWTTEKTQVGWGGIAGTPESLSDSRAGAVASLCMGRSDSTRNKLSIRQGPSPSASNLFNPSFTFTAGEKTGAGYADPYEGTSKPRNSRLLLPSVLGPRDTYQPLTERLAKSNDPATYIPVVAGGLNGIVTGSRDTHLSAGPYVIIRRDANGPVPPTEQIDIRDGKGMVSGVPFWRADTFFLLRQSKSSNLPKKYAFKIITGRESIMMPIAPYASVDPGTVFHEKNSGAQLKSRFFNKLLSATTNLEVESISETSRDLITYGQMTHYGYAAAADSYLDTIWEDVNLDSSVASGSFTGLNTTGHDHLFKTEIFSGATPRSLPLFGQAIKLAHQVDYANLTFPSNPANLDKNTSMLSDAPDTFQGQFSFFAGENAHKNIVIGLTGFDGNIPSRQTHPHGARYYAEGRDTTSPLNPGAFQRALTLDTWVANPFASINNPFSLNLSASAFFGYKGVGNVNDRNSYDISNEQSINVGGSGFSLITTPAWPVSSPGVDSGQLAYSGYDSYPDFWDHGNFEFPPDPDHARKAFGYERRPQLGAAPKTNWLDAGLGKELNYFVSASHKHEGTNPDYPDSWAGFTLMTASTAWRPFSSPGRESAAIGLQANVYKRQYLDYRKKIVLDVPVKSAAPSPVEAAGYWVTTSENDRSPRQDVANNPLPNNPSYSGTDEAILRIPEPGDPRGVGTEGVTGPSYRRARSAKRFHQRNTSMIQAGGFRAGTIADDLSQSRNLIRSSVATSPTTARASSAVPYGVQRSHRAAPIGVDSAWQDEAELGKLIDGANQTERVPTIPNAESLYVLKPNDKLVLGVQPALPGWNPGSGLPNNRHVSKYGIWDYSGSYANGTAMTHDLESDGATMRDGLMNLEDPYEPSHGLTMLSVPSRVVLYGTLMKNNKHKPSNSTQQVNSAAVHEALHFDNPVLDQFLTDGREEYSGNTLGQIVDGEMSGVSDLIGDARRVIGDIGSANLAFSGSFQRFTKSSESSQVFFDTLLQDPYEIAAVDGAVNRTGDVNVALFGGSTLIHLHQAPAEFAPTLAYLNNVGSKPNFAITSTWADSFPFEAKYSSVERSVDRDGSKFTADGSNLWVSLRSPAVVGDVFAGGTTTIMAGGPDAFGTIVGTQYLFLSSSGDILWDGLSHDQASMNFLQGFGWQVSGISDMANTSQSQGQDDIAFVDPSGTPSTNPTAQNASLARLVAASDTTEKIKSFRTLFASIAGYGRQNRKQLDFAFSENIGLTILDQDGTTQSCFGRSLRFHPAGLKYGYMNCDHLSPSTVHRGDRYGQFRDMLEQRLYGKTYSFGDEFNKRGQTEAAVSCIFVDADGAPIEDSTKTQCLNLSTAMTSSKPFIEGEVMREIIFSSESVTVE